MIPLKEEPTISNELLFNVGDTARLQECANIVLNSGKTLIMVAQHEMLLAHYTRTLLTQLSGSRAGKVTVRRMPKNSEAVLDGLNKRLAQVNLESFQAKKSTPLNELWLYELPNLRDTGLLEMTVKMISQFRATGISLIVHFRQVRPESAQIKKLAEKLRAQSVDFPQPSEEEAKALLERLAGRPELSQVSQLVDALGLSPGKKRQDGDVAAFPKGMGQSTAAALAKRNVANQTAATLQLTKLRQARGRVVASSGIACLLIAAAYLGQDADLSGAASRIAQQIQSLPISFSDDATAPDANSGAEVSAPAVDAEAQSQASLAPLLPAAQPSQDVEKKQLPIVVNDPEKALKEIFVTQPVTDVAPAVAPPVTDGVYVQHASFSLPQRAFIWRGNTPRLPGVRVFEKGDRYVVVSGPFLNREEARQHLVDYGINKTPFFISGATLGNFVERP